MKIFHVVFDMVFEVKFLNRIALARDVTTLYTKKTISLIYGQRKNFFKLKKVLLIQKNFL